MFGKTVLTQIHNENKMNRCNYKTNLHIRQQTNKRTIKANDIGPINKTNLIQHKLHKTIQYIL